MRIGVLVGSLRKESYNKKLANTLIQVAPASCNMKIIDISQLSFFNQDDEPNPPQSWLTFRDEIKSIDGFLIVTPEYNRSFPAVLKNALDIGSRPYGSNLWQGKPCAIVSCSIGAMGGFGANHHLRQSMVFLDAPCLQQPEVYLSFADKLFDEKGSLTNNDTRAFLEKFMNVFATWIKTNKK